MNHDSAEILDIKTGHITKKNYGFSFDPAACIQCEGLCCLESGYVWVKKPDIIRIADFLAVEPDFFIEKYLEKKGRRYTIKESRCNKEFPCAFFDMESKECLIYPVRPTQCKTFPFWNEFIGENHIYAPDYCTGIKKFKTAE